MKRILSVLSVALLWGAVACNPTNNNLPCSQDYNCISGEKCYQGFCTPADKVPVGSTETTTTPDGGSTPDGSAQPETSQPESTQPETAKPAEYPTGPYGADVGEVSINIDLSTCADPSKRVGMKEYFNKNNIKVLYLSVHTGWCPSCRSQAQTLEPLFQKYKDRGLMVWNIMTEDGNAGGGKITPEYCTAHGAQYKYTFPLLIDEGSAFMNKFFDRNAVPLSMLVRTSDMKIIYKLSGSIPDRIEGLIAAELQ
ncbi:MAG: redoxin domain-containing protein [Myxococcales bacterium]|nr:redoxin domain-containing protein [Myxococcales bacterium]